MTPRELEEYRALRDTIRERGTTRAWLLLATFVAWAALAIATASLAALPVATLLPLLVLAVGFETGFALHTGVERIARYALERARERRKQEFSAPSEQSPSPYPR